MYWITKDGTLRYPEIIVVVNALDRWIIMMETEKEAEEHKLRDGLIEYGLKQTWAKILRDWAMIRMMGTVAETKVEEAKVYPFKYKAYGIWIAGLLDAAGKKSPEEEDNEDMRVSQVDTTPEEVEKKRREYVR
jgi:hypothetical protein